MFWLIIGWYVSGVIFTNLLFLINLSEITVYDFVMSFLVGLLGPIVTLFIIVTAAKKCGDDVVIFSIKE